MLLKAVIGGSILESNEVIGNYVSLVGRENTPTNIRNVLKIYQRGMIMLTLKEEEAIRKVVELKKKYNEDYLRITARARLAAKDILRKKYTNEIIQLLEEE